MYVCICTYLYKSICPGVFFPSRNEWRSHRFYTRKKLHGLHEKELLSRHMSSVTTRARVRSLSEIHVSSSCGTVDEGKENRDEDAQGEDAQGKDKQIKRNLSCVSRWELVTLSLLWLLLLVYGECIMPHLVLRSCQWPKISSWNEENRLFHLGIVADPQLTDRYSYKMKPGWMLWLTEFYSDVYMRKNYKVIQNMADKPDTVLILGDIFDGGRILTKMEFDDHMTRFRSIFGGADFPLLNMSGNHDVGLGKWFDAQALARHEKVFGKSSFVSRLPIGIDLVAVDSIGLVTAGSKAHRKAKQFLLNMEIADSKTAPASRRPRVLFSHIPLYRPDGSDCGARRKKRSIRQGYGESYQNVLSERQTAELFKIIRPIHIFSGDDHSPCEYVHPNGVREDTIATFSWLQGEHRPEFGMVTLQRSRSDASDVNVLVYICSLPPQIFLYGVYAVLGILSLLLLVLEFTAGMLEGRRSNYIRLPREENLGMHMRETSRWEAGFFRAMQVLRIVGLPIFIAYPTLLMLQLWLYR